MKIYTKTGDAGTTGVFAGPRVAKDHPRMEACGTVDELNAALGVARANGLPPEIDTIAARVQHELFALGAELGTPDPEASGTALLNEDHVTAIERAIDQFEATLAPLQNFILPGGTIGAANLHLARAVCRRAERCVVTLSREADGKIRGRAIVYLNRLGDLLFVLARAANAMAGEEDVVWEKLSV